MNNRIVVDLDKCLGAGLCTLAPKYFELSENGKVILLEAGEVPTSDLPAVEDAVTMCPAEAIRLRGSD